MKTLIAVLLVLLAVLQYKLWFEGGSAKEVKQLQQKINTQTQENNLLQKRNDILTAEIKDLKEGQEAIEERARDDLGMIKKDEQYYQVVPKS